MKRINLFAGILCMFLIASCSNTPKEHHPGAKCDKAARTECPNGEKKHHQPCEMSEEQKAACEKWKNFDNLSAEEQKELIANKKACIDKCEAERKAAMEAFEAKWANFDSLTVAEQKELLEQKTRCMGPKCMGPKGKFDKKECPMEKAKCEKNLQENK